MVGTIDSKGIRNVKSVQTVAATVFSAEITAVGQVAAIGLNASDGTLSAYPIQISAGNGTAVTPGKWGISLDILASGETGNFVVAGVAPVVSNATSGAYVMAMSSLGTITAQVTVASYITGLNLAPLGMYSSALNDNAGGMIIW